MSETAQAYFADRAQRALAQIHAPENTDPALYLIACALSDMRARMQEDLKKQHDAFQKEREEKQAEYAKEKEKAETEFAEQKKKAESEHRAVMNRHEEARKAAGQSRDQKHAHLQREHGEQIKRLEGESGRKIGELRDVMNNARRQHNASGFLAKQMGARKVAELEARVGEEIRRLQREQSVAEGSLRNELARQLAESDAALEKENNAIGEREKRQTADYTYRLELLKNKRNSRIRTLDEELGRFEKEKADAEADLRASCERSLTEELLSLLSDARLQNGIHENAKHAFAFLPYAGVSQIPSYLDLGTIGLHFPELTKGLSEENAGRIARQMSQLLQVKESPDIFVPDIRAYRHGVSFFLQAESDSHMEDIRSLVLRLLMQFPAGRLHLLMIAPRNNRCFAGIVRLGNGHAEIVNTKVWDAEADIADQIRKFKSALSEDSAQYAGNRAAYLEKRPHKLLAISDFPYGFDAGTLDVLDIILEQAYDFGTSVIICCNQDVLAEYEKDEQLSERIRRIRARMLTLSDLGDGRLFITNPSGSLRTDYAPPVVFYDPFAVGVLEAAGGIIDEISAHVEDNAAEAITLNDMHGTLLKGEEWHSKSVMDGMVLPIGVSGVDVIERLVIGRPQTTDIRQHVLIEGSTGAGKSVLLHAIITAALMYYGPDQMQLVLLDYKIGMEMSIYANYDLPGVRVVSTESAREFGRSTFREMCRELNERAKRIKEALPDDMVQDIYVYQQKTNKVMPFILFVVDEFETLIGNGTDEIAVSILNDLAVLVKQGRAVGIHIVLSSQTISLPSSISGQMALRLALMGSKNILDSDKSIDLLQPMQAILNDNAGDKDNDHIFQVVFVVDELKETLQKISARTAGATVGSGIGLPRKIMHGSIEEYIRHPFHFPEGTEHARDAGIPSYELSLGANFSYRDMPDIRLAKGAGENLLMAVRSNAAKRLLTNAAVSLIYADALQTGTMYAHAGRPFLIVADMCERDEYEGGEDADRGLLYLRSALPFLVDYTDREDGGESGDFFGGFAERIAWLYREMRYRQGAEGETPFLCLLLKGMDSLRALADNEDKDEEGGTIGRLGALIREGARVNIHVLATLGRFERAEMVLGEGFEKSFRHRIASHMKPELMLSLVNGTDLDALNEHTAFRYHVLKEEPVLFRMFDEPGMKWLKRFAENIKRLYGVR